MENKYLYHFFQYKIFLEYKSNNIIYNSKLQTNQLLQEWK